MMKRVSILFTLLLLMIFSLSAQEIAPVKGCKTITFTFAPGKDTFILQGNEAELTRLYQLVDEYCNEISSGRMPLHVDGYCTSQLTSRENLHTAFVRANRVKSELIEKKALKEANFITNNYETAWQGHKDVVVVTLRIPADVVKQQPESVVEQPRKEISTVAVEQQPEVNKEAQYEQVTETTATSTPLNAIAAYKPYCVAVRTNLLYDAMLLPTLGVEWRINRDLGIKLDGSLSWWGNEHGKVQKMWLLNPEVRWYLLTDRRFYVGASGSYGEYNIYGFPLGKMMTDDTGYQGKLWNAGLTVGYQLYLSRGFSVDFNLGLGYTRSEYDSFTMIDGVRVYKDRNRTKNFWGPTQAGISLVWTIGGNK